MGTCRAVGFYEIGRVYKGFRLGFIRDLGLRVDKGFRVYKKKIGLIKGLGFIGGLGLRVYVMGSGFGFMLSLSDWQMRCWVYRGCVIRLGLLVFEMTLRWQGFVCA